MKTPSDEELMLELRKVNKKLIESEELKSHFLSNIRNEINNPMTVILGFSQNIMDTDISDKSLLQIKSMARHIFLEAFQLDFQLRNIFMAAEIEAGEAIPELSECNLQAVAEGLKSYFEPQLKQKNITLKLNVNHHEPVYLDVAKLRLILVNLLANAIKFSETDTRIDLDIQVSLEKKQIHFSIKDEGIGISDENQALIFDRFRQLDEGTSRAYQGHGLGLCIVKALVEMLDGKLNIQSKSGESSIFSFYLPILDHTDIAKDFTQEDDALFFDDKTHLF